MLEEEEHWPRQPLRYDDAPPVTVIIEAVRSWRRRRTPSVSRRTPREDRPVIRQGASLPLLAADEVARLRSETTPGTAAADLLR